LFTGLNQLRWGQAALVKSGQIGQRCSRLAAWQIEPPPGAVAWCLNSQPRPHQPTPLTREVLRGAG
jgi:hypothetical protein